jgi:DNA-binding NarL/FixJ family response regulator
MLLDSQSDFVVVAEASDVESARRYVHGHHPGVLVLDLNMPGGSSLKAIPTIREESPGTQIVVLTMQQEPAFAREALGAGALGYVLKEEKRIASRIANRAMTSDRDARSHADVQRQGTAGRSPPRTPPASRRSLRRSPLRAR